MNLPPQFSAQSLLRGVAFALWAVAALASRDLMPWLFWATMFALPALSLLTSEKSYFSSRPGRGVLKISSAVFVLHVIWAICRSGYYDASVPETYWLDDYNYYQESAALAEAWRAGEYPDFWLKGSPPYLGTLHTGYHRPLSALFFLFGPATVWGLILNAMCASAIPVLAALCGRYLWDRELAGNDAPPLKDFGFLAAMLAALHPTQFYWAAYLMKDMYVAFIFLSGLALVLGLSRRKNFGLAIGSAMVIPYMFTVRAYTAMSLLLGTLTLPFLGLSRKVVIRATVAGIVLLFLVCAYTSTGNTLYRQLRDSFLALTPPGLGSPADLLLQMVAGIPRLFLAPYAWLILPEPTPMYGMYPGMWYLYLLGYPLGFSGLYWAIRRNVRLAAVPLMVFALTALIFLSAVYRGDASRQRYYLEYVILLFAAYGIRNFSRAWAFSILGLEVAFAVGQVISLQ